MTIADYPTHEITRLITYLNNFKEEATRINGNEQIINIATKCFWKLLNYFSSTDNGTLEIPDCCPNNGSEGDFHIFFTWERDEHYLECEIDVEGEADFSYRNNLTKETWGYTYDSSNPKFPDSEWLLDKLSLFTE